MSGSDIFGFILSVYLWLYMNPLVGILIYFSPIVIAFIRKHKNTGIITILGLLFGWIFLLWFILIIWAMIGEKTSDESEPQKMNDEQKQKYDKAKAAEEAAKKRAMEMYD